ncbi:MAG: sodium:proton exchanger, partial [Chloroflexi bacterium]|nr:sodium:proton exchanger [Chloroflexota bacterium]
MLAFGVFLILLFFISLLSRRLERTIITAPIVFTLGGMILVWTQLVDPERVAGSHTTLLLGEITLVMLLFTDATRIKIGALWRSAFVPVRLLLIGMPLTILLGVVVAAILFDSFSIWEAAILATILAPTDAGLGQVVVSSPRVPARIRQALNVEAGLNDGLSVPFLMLFIALAQVTDPSADLSWLPFTLQQIGFGVLVGVALGWLGGWLMGQAQRHSWMVEAIAQLGLLSLALLAWLIADEVGGNGFIAAFVAGIVVKNRFEDAGTHAVEFSEAWGQLLNYLVLFGFGIMAASKLDSMNLTIIAFATLSLTVIRMVPVAVSMIGTQFKPATLVFLGWFGPRGLASIVLGLVFLEQEAHLVVTPVILLVVIATVLLSIFAHGFSALPGISWYNHSLKTLEPGAAER